MTLGEAFRLRLEGYLKERGISLYRFVKDSCISRSTITNLLLGNSGAPNLRTLYQVARGLGVSVVEFLDCELFEDEGLLLD